MLQQTTVETVKRRFERFLERFPTVRRLASARLETVLSEWSGLGYYARARNLHRAAKKIVAEHGGLLPRRFDELRSLPGLGDYTAAAIIAIAFDRYALPLDANIRRVASRVFASRDPQAELPRLVSRARPGDSVAALFDLGQLVCRPRDPRCDGCPLRRRCSARRLGQVLLYPAARERPRRRKVFLSVAAIERDGKFLLRKRRSSWLDGLWEFPSEEAPRGRDARNRLRLRHRVSERPLVSLRHSVVNRDLRIEVFRGKPDDPLEPGRWMSCRQIATSAAPTLTKKIAESLARAGARA